MALKLWRGEVIVSAGWSIKPGQDTAHLDIRIFHPFSDGSQGNVCYASVDRPALAPKDCIRDVRGQIPLANFSGLGLRPSRDARAAAAMTRWLNTNSDIITASGEPFIGSNEGPSEVVLRGRYEQ
jgi:hypothetical protein